MYVVALRQYLSHSSYHMGVASPGSRRNISVFLGGTSGFTKRLLVSTNLTPCRKREHGGENVWDYQKACVSEADEALSFSWRCQRFCTVTQEKSPAVLLRKFPFALARFLHLVCRQHGDYILSPSQAADKSENRYQKK